MSKLLRSAVALFLSVSLATFGAGCLHHESLEDDMEELDEEELDEVELDEVELGDDALDARSLRGPELPSEAPTLVAEPRGPGFEVDGRFIEVHPIDEADLRDSDLIGEAEIVPYIGATARLTGEEAAKVCKANGGTWSVQLSMCRMPDVDTSTYAGVGG